jgi:hypothetical protein
MQGQSSVFAFHLLQYPSIFDGLYFPVLSFAFLASLPGLIYAFFFPMKSSDAPKG